MGNPVAESLSIYKAGLMKDNTPYIVRAQNNIRVGLHCSWYIFLCLTLFPRLHISLNSKLYLAIMKDFRTICYVKNNLIMLNWYSLIYTIICIEQLIAVLCINHRLKVSLYQNIRFIQILLRISTARQPDA